MEIPEDVVRQIPAKQIEIRKIVPFEYDQKTNTLKIACEDPTDQQLINDINYIVQGKFVKLYVAAEIALDTAIKKYIHGQKTNLKDKLSLELPDLVSSDDTDNAEVAQADERQSSRKVLFITDEEYSGSLFQTILNRDDYDTAICDNLAEAYMMIEENQYSAIFIRESLLENFGEFISRVRSKSARTIIRKYDRSSDLILSEDSFISAGHFLERNLTLLTSLLSSKDGLADNHSGIVGQYTEKLCRKLGLPVEDRLAIANAAYLHDIAKYHYPDVDKKNYREQIELSARLLESLDYSPEVLGIINSMYQDLDTEKSKQLPLEYLGGNIITIVDLFCENIQLDQKLTLEKLDAVNKKLRDLSGKLFLSEVVEAFILMMKEEILDLHTNTGLGQAFIFSNISEYSYPLELRLKNEGYRIISESNAGSVIQLFKRSKPDVLIMAFKKDAQEIDSIISELVTNDIDFKKIPTFILTEKETTTQLASTYDKGIEDILALNGNYDLLLMKIKKIIAQLQTRKAGADTDSSGARGRLSDMNLIDLMQALAPGRKTARLTITSNIQTDTHLEIYLNKGNIIYAKLDEKMGADAIYEGMTWTDGNWSVEPIDESQLPEPNNQLSNDAILMEGAYQLDEKIRAGKL
jgi:putative nucleotidyltransferase with HDIG domain